METLILIQEAADILDLSPDMVRKIEAQGKLCVLRVGPQGTRMFTKSSVLRLAEERATNPPKRGPKSKPTDQARAAGFERAKK